MTKYHVPSFDYHFQKGLLKKKKKKRTFQWIRLNPETTWSAELKIKGSKNWPLRRKEDRTGGDQRGKEPLTFSNENSRD